MYTGIVQGRFEVVNVEKKTGLHRLTVKLPDNLLTDLQLGASVALDGVCLTVAGIDSNNISFDVIAETMRLTTLSHVESGSLVNVERSAKIGDENGGHNISGHIDGTVEIIDIETPKNNWNVTFKAPESFMPYIFHKGFVGLNGASLTVASVDHKAATFSVSLIPETLRLTTFGLKKTGDRVNLEIERQTQVIVDTVKNLLKSQPEFLQALLKTA